MHPSSQTIQPPPVQPTWQVPSVHVSPAEQVFPHAPQFATSDVVSTQYADEPVLQVWRGAAQVFVQAPCAHASPSAQAFPQTPQLATSN
jgi:hypothetical protein